MISNVAAADRPSLHTAQRTGPMAVAAGAIVVPALLMTAFALIPQPPYGAEPFHDAWRRHAIVAVALLAWLAALAIRRRAPRPSPLLLPLLILLAVFTASNFLHPDWRIGIEPLLDLLSAILVLQALTDTPGLSPRRLTYSLMLSASALSVVALQDVWERWQDWLTLQRAVLGAGTGWLPPTVPRVLNVGTNPNILAPLLAMAVPLLIYLLLSTSGARRALWLLVLAVVQAAIFFTLSRSTWIGEAGGLAVTSAGFVLARGRLRIPRRLLVVAASAAVGLVAAAFLAIVVQGARPLWLFRPSLSARSDFRGAALALIERNPILGIGPGRFVLAYPLVSDGDPAGAVHSHNVLIQIALESGVLGLFAALAVVAVIVFAVWQAWRAADSLARMQLAAAAGGLSVFAIAGMGDALHLFPEILFTAGLLLTIALACRQRPAVPSAERRLAMVLMPLLALALLAAWARIDRAEQYYGHAWSLSQGQQWASSANAAAQAIALDPDLAIYHVQRGLALEQEAESGTGDVQRQQAVEELQRALAIEPRSASTRLELAVVYAAAGGQSDAAGLLPQIVSEAPRDPLTLLGAAVLEEGIEPEASIPIYSAALAQSPRIVDSPFWRETEFRRAHYGEIVSRALVLADTEDSSAGPAATREIIEGGAGLPISGQDSVARVEEAQADAQQGDVIDASRLLTPTIRSRPDDPAIRLALGNVDAEEGNTAAARKQWLAGAYLGDAASVLRLGETFAPATVPEPLRLRAEAALQDLWIRQFSITQQHYRFAFRRQEPMPVVLRGDWLNALPAVYSQLDEALSRWPAATTGQTAPAFP